MQISRIQVRRGQKNQGSGLPQLASGEIAWAIDTQELFVGNGAVAEGAPYVGNTKILTEHDSLLDFVDSYIYKDFNGSSIQTGSDPNFPIERSVRERLDERVSVLSFGAIGDGSTDNTAALQRAIDQLFLNPATVNTPDTRVVLEVPAGTYILSGPVYIPSYCNIIGAGPGKTVFRHSHSDSAFIFVNDTSVTGSYNNSLSSVTVTYNNQCKYVRMEGFSVISTVSTETMFLMNAVRDSFFHQIELSTDWASLDGSNTDNAGFRLQAVSDIVTCNRLYFTQCTAKNVSYGVFSKYDIENCNWDSCEFQNCYVGISFGLGTDLFNPGQLYGPRRSRISHSTFTLIDREGIRISNGTGNSSKSNKFVSVGNDGSNNLNAVTSHIKFESEGNLSMGDWFDRADDLAESNLSSPYKATVEGIQSFNSSFVRSVDILQSAAPSVLIRLPYYGSSAYSINYMYQSISNTAGDDIMRKGTMSIAVDQLNGNIQFVDEYESAGTPGTDSNLLLTASLVDTNGSGGVDTLVVYYTNSTVNDNGKFRYTYSVIS